MILEYLRKRGHKNAEQALREALEDGGAEASETVVTVSDEELRKHLVPFWEKKEGSGDNALSDGDITMQSLLTGGVTAPSVTKLLESIGPGGADEILSLDPTDRHEGFRDLEAWVDGSLDMYRVRHRNFASSRCPCSIANSQNSDQFYSQYSAISTWTSFSWVSETQVPRGTFFVSAFCNIIATQECGSSTRSRLRCRIHTQESCTTCPNSCYRRTSMTNLPNGSATRNMCFE